MSTVPSTPPPSLSSLICALIEAEIVHREYPSARSGARVTQVCAQIDLRYPAALTPDEARAKAWDERPPSGPISSIPLNRS